MQGKEQKITEMVTSKIIAERLGVHRATVNRIASKHQIGTVIGNQRIFSAKEVLKIKGICKFAKGNPNFGKK